MGGLFYKCQSLKSLPDISKWNTSNATDMNGLFYECSSLLSLPDISKWNTNNVIYINEEQSENIKPIVVALFVSHFDISGKDNNEEQPSKVLVK